MNVIYYYIHIKYVLAFYSYTTVNLYRYSKLLVELMFFNEFTVEL